MLALFNSGDKLKRRNDFRRHLLTQGLAAAGLAQLGFNFNDTRFDAFAESADWNCDVFALLTAWLPTLQEDCVHAREMIRFVQDNERHIILDLAVLGDIGYDRIYPQLNKMQAEGVPRLAKYNLSGGEARRKFVAHLYWGKFNDLENELTSLLPAGGASFEPQRIGRRFAERYRVFGESRGPEYQQTWLRTYTTVYTAPLEKARDKVKEYKMSLSGEYSRKSQVFDPKRRERVSRDVGDYRGFLGNEFVDGGDAHQAVVEWEAYWAKPSHRPEGTTLEQWWETHKLELLLMYAEARRILPKHLHSMQVESSFRYLKLARNDQQIKMTPEQHFLRCDYVWNGALD